MAWHGMARHVEYITSRNGTSSCVKSYIHSVPDYLAKVDGVCSERLSVAGQDCAEVRQQWQEARMCHGSCREYRGGEGSLCNRAVPRITYRIHLTLN